MIRVAFCIFLIGWCSKIAPAQNRDTISVSMECWTPGWHFLFPKDSLTFFSQDTFKSYVDGDYFVLDEFNVGYFPMIDPSIGKGAEIDILIAGVSLVEKVALLGLVESTNEAGEQLVFIRFYVPEISEMDEPPSYWRKKGFFLRRESKILLEDLISRGLVFP